MPQGNDQYLTDLDVRAHMRDNVPELNLLLDDLEFSTEEIRQGMTVCADFWNEALPPGRSYKYTNFPYRFMLLTGVCARLLMMAAHRMRRNVLPEKVPGGSISDQDKHGAYDAAAQKLWDEFKQAVSARKLADSAARGFGYG